MHIIACVQKHLYNNRFHLPLCCFQFINNHYSSLHSCIPKINSFYRASVTRFFCFTMLYHWSLIRLCSNPVKKSKIYRKKVCHHCFSLCILPSASTSYYILGKLSTLHVFSKYTQKKCQTLIITRGKHILPNILRSEVIKPQITCKRL